MEQETKRVNLRKGDYVMFTASHDDDVPYGVSEEMERNMRGVIYRIAGTRTTSNRRWGEYQVVYVEDCEYTTHGGSATGMLSSLMFKKMSKKDLSVVPKRTTFDDIFGVASAEVTV